MPLSRNETSTEAAIILAAIGCVAGVLACSSLLMSAAAAGDKSAGTALPQLGAASTGVSVSGISSGAYMAGQFQLAHAEKVLGAAIIAGGPYGCAKSAFSSFWFSWGEQVANLAKAVNGCMLNNYSFWGVPNAGALARQAENLARDAMIDPLQQVVRHKVYLFSGKEDRTVVPEIVDAARQFYIRLGVPSTSIKYVDRYSAGHAFVTEDAGPSCELSGKPYIVDCDYDQAGDLLAHIYGPLNPRVATPGGDYVRFDQRPFTDGTSRHGMASTGVVYIPTACRQTRGCRVHIAFHGCGQNRSEVGDTFVKESGFARWADSNRLIVLFPQIEAGPGNPEACWDWWGYTGADFLTRSAAQITTINLMLEHLASDP